MAILTVPHKVINTANFSVCYVMTISSSMFNVMEPNLSPVQSACEKHFQNKQHNNLIIFVQHYSVSDEGTTHKPELNL